eukprot:CAMPEP_0194087322 /NCGR_PEP_ID=MMETSP0149-20130528/24530_1 /TAXON_ID=122233 /ORGANISM="Chaetoceros debilis, Strain MM31A-1" /LENGTH=502 /DNA_ID=CAMNT_0038770639 /DNA_START=54 /DNA_END=1562 /DNA_ORIENTATION=+
MEDRHAFSDPRPVPLDSTDGRHTWLVDIYRNGVEDPIDTIEISEVTLPPRKKKGGKVAWRLPSDYSRVPSFPVDEKRRIMELFKERKKNRRKNKGSTSSNSLSSVVDNGSTNGVGLSSHSLPTSTNECSDRGGIGKSDNGKSRPANDLKIPLSSKGGGEKQEVVAKGGSGKTAAPSSSKKKKNRKEKIKRQLSQSAPAPDTVVAENQQVERTSSSKSGSVNGNDATPIEAHVNSSSQAASQPSTPPMPPGFKSSMSELSLNGEIGASQADSNDGKDFSKKSLTEESVHSNSTNTQPFVAQQAAPPILLQPRIGSRFITIPERDRLQIKSSLAIAAAKTFIDIYYPHITHCLSQELTTYYTPHAQKSISVGGAHSVVATPKEIMMQLLSLARSVFIVRGVVSQDTFDSSGAHILVTGVVQTSGVTSQFAHSVSLVPVVGQGFSFQIHNDALSLLTSDGVRQAEPIPTRTGFEANGHHQSQQNLQHGEQFASPRNFSHPPGLGL